MIPLKEYALNVKDNNLLFTISFLDKIDLTEYLDQDNIDDIMCAIEDDYGHLFENDPVLQGFVFNHMSSEEFKEYLYEKSYIEI